MSYPFDYFESALEDAEDIIAYLDEQRPGYGRKFYDCLDEIIKIICKNPAQFARTRARPDLRKVPLPKPFQKTYSLYYHFDGTYVYIVTVFNNSRNPREWKRR